MLKKIALTDPPGTLEKALDLPARSRFGEGRADPFEYQARPSVAFAGPHSC